MSFLFCFWNKKNDSTVECIDHDGEEEKYELKNKRPSQGEKKIELEKIYGPDEWHIEKLERLEIASLSYLGHGAFSVVKKGFSKKYNMDVAIKIIKYSEASKKYWNTVLPGEIELWREISSTQDHPNILMLKDEIRFGGYQYLVSDVADRDNLNDLLLGANISEAKIKALFQDVLTAVSFCHNKKIAHRDIKPENLLIGRNDQLKLAGIYFLA